jgi:hypothetical protein
LWGLKANKAGTYSAALSKRLNDLLDPKGYRVRWTMEIETQKTTDVLAV